MRWVCGCCCIAACSTYTSPACLLPSTPLRSSSHHPLPAVPSPSCCPLHTSTPQIEYIFSDKTGTLTSNEMQLREIAVKGVAYGTSEVRLEEHSDRTGLAALRLFDQRLYKAAAKVQRSTSWTGLISAGGSKKVVMAHPTSYPNLDSVDSLGIEEPDSAGAQLGACFWVWWVQGWVVHTCSREATGAHACTPTVLRAWAS